MNFGSFSPGTWVHKPSGERLDDTGRTSNCLRQMPQLVKLRVVAEATPINRPSTMNLAETNVPSPCLNPCGLRPNLTPRHQHTAPRLQIYQEGSAWISCRYVCAKRPRYNGFPHASTYILLCLPVGGRSVWVCARLLLPKSDK